MKVSGVVHMHSAYSYDAKVTLPDLKTLLVSAGHSFAFMTEHTDAMTTAEAEAFVDECRELSDASFVFVPGFEVPYKDAHILMLGCASFFGQTADASELRVWAETASFVSLAHPVRNHFVVDAVMQEVIDGVEIWNQQYDGSRVPRVGAYYLLAALRKEKPQLLATGGLDFHRIEHLTKPVHTLEIASLNEASLIEAYSAGEGMFGSQKIVLTPNDAWDGATHLSVRLTSALSVCVITGSKKISALLASMGISLPKKLTQSIRRRI